MNTLPYWWAPHTAFSDAAMNAFATVSSSTMVYPGPRLDRSTKEEASNALFSVPWGGNQPPQTTAKWSGSNYLIHWSDPKNTNHISQRKISQISSVSYRLRVKNVKPIVYYLVISPQKPFKNQKSCSSPFCPRIKFVQLHCLFTNSTPVSYSWNIPVQILQPCSRAENIPEQILQQFSTVQHTWTNLPPSSIHFSRHSLL